MANDKENLSEALKKRAEETSGSNVEKTARPAAQKSRRGFASMDPERRRQVASSGGRTAHKQGVAHKWTREEASAAGRKGQALRRSGE